MGALWATLRLLLAEKLMHAAMVVAPANLKEGHAVVAAVGAYFEGQVATQSHKRI